MTPRGRSDLDTTLSFKKTAGGITVGMNKLFSEGLLPNVNFTFQYFYDQCQENLAAGGTVQLIKDGDVDVIIGPSCTASARIAGTIGTFYNFPIFIWSTVLSAEFSDIVKYPTIASTALNTYSIVKAMGDLFDFFQWNEFAFFYGVSLSSAVPRCASLQNDMDTFVSSKDNMTMVYKRSITNDSYETLRAALRRMKTNARIIVTCLEAPTSRRDFIKAAADEKMLNDEYVYLYVQTIQSGFVDTAYGAQPFWIDTSPNPDGRDAELKEASKKILILDMEQLPSNFPEFSNDVMKAMYQWPVNCVDPYCPPAGANATKQATFLADTFYMYGIALNRTLTQYPSNPNIIRNGSVMISNSRVSFKGFSGRVITDENGLRLPILNVFALDNNGNQQVYIIMEQKDNTTNSTVIYPQYSSAQNGIWQTRNGVTPLSHPKCDFDGTGCPPSFVQTYLGYVIGGVILITIFITVFIVLICYNIKSRTEQRRQLDLLWQIPYIRLRKPDEKTDVTKSTRSVASTISSTSTRVTIMSKKDTDTFEYFFIDTDPVVAKKHLSRPKFTEADFVVFRAMQKANHDNLCKFMGLCFDGPIYLSLWKYCSRGCLRDVIERNAVQMDGFFMHSLIKDIASGISFLHNSPYFNYHGEISSRTCLIDERWQVKITLYGLFPFKNAERKDEEGLIWCAPEVLRSEGMIYGSQQADIYSFAIVASEIISQKPAWNYEDEELDFQDIIYKVKKLSNPPFRPSLEIDPNVEINTSLLHLIRDSWAEKPQDRPTIHVINTLLKSMHKGKAKNLMDHVFHILEQYANNLEAEVEMRTRELAEEKKKSDILLYRMLPRTVADRLKLGQSVEPESFEAITIFFSDVVGFTTLAARSSPIQVVNLLNDLYSTFDTIIDQFSCFKVETIGDAYLVCSGLPLRNGNNHAKDIADMSIGFLKAIKIFRVPHLPKEKVNIRIGIHTGSCVAGVVGLTMPRYCLFGDTVNTASRMESNGKPGKIHVSPSTNHYLTKIIGGYETYSRGEVLIKGKGVMETFFLCTGDDDENIDI
uniref:Guanylate cyclase n=1 Tax=Panagrolaimus sp. PS1159 TaxID=55785 RepID=A0AC35EVN2_9BILA